MKRTCEKFNNELYASKVKIDELKPHFKKEKIQAVTFDELEMTVKKLKPNK